MFAKRYHISALVFPVIVMMLVLHLLSTQIASGQGDPTPERLAASSVVTNADRGTTRGGQIAHSAAVNNLPQPRSKNYRLFDFAVSAGGGVHGSASYTGASIVGQAFDSGRSTSVHYQIASGYFAGSQAVPLYLAWTYLPLVFKNFFNFFDGPFEVEPNNSSAEANGLLRSGQDYFGYPNDAKDYFSFLSNASGAITINLTNYTGGNGQVQVFYQSTDNRVAYDLDAPFNISYSGPAGLYYIYLSTGSNHNSTFPYTLRVTYP